MTALFRDELISTRLRRIQTLLDHTDTRPESRIEAANLLGEMAEEAEAFEKETEEAFINGLPGEVPPVGFAPADIPADPADPQPLVPTAADEAGVAAILAGNASEEIPAAPDTDPAPTPQE
jgi:hypothetical protein